MKGSFTTPVVKSATASEMEITVTLELESYDGWRNRFSSHRRGERRASWTIIKSYHGKSTRRVTRNSENELIRQKIEMEEEAKKIALMECFKDGMRFTEFNDLVYDELHRPINLKPLPFESLNA